MSRYTIPKPIVWAKKAIDRGLDACSEVVDKGAESFVSNVLKIRPAEPAVNDDVPEEVEWLESDRSQLKYRRDSLWAIPKMWTEMAAGAAGAGTYIVSRAAGNQVGMVAGWAVAAGVKGVLLFTDLGRPDRVWRVFAKPSTSWIARGSWAFATFAGAGAVSLLPFAPEPVRKGSGIVADAAGVFLMTYDGLFLKESKGVASWNSNTLPLLFLADAVQVGANVAGGMTRTAPGWMRALSVGSSAVSAGLHYAYVSELDNGNTAAKLSARDLTETAGKNRFVGDSFSLGTVVPAAINVLFGNKPCARSVAGAASAIGTLALRRSVLQAGIHAPVQNPPRRQS